MILKARGSAQRQNRLAAACERLPTPIKPLALVQDVRTRWNSTHDSMKRSLYLRNAIDFMMDEEPNTYGNSLTEDDWKTVEAFVEFLAPFEGVTRHMSADSYPTLSSIIPYMNSLLDFLDRKIINLTGSNNSV